MEDQGREDPHWLELTLPRHDEEASPQAVTPCPLKDREECEGCEKNEGLESDACGARTCLFCYQYIPGSKPRLLPRLADQLPVSRIMSRKVSCVRADLSIQELATLFLEEDIPAFPVLNKSGRLIGIVSNADVVREWYLQKRWLSNEPRYTAGQIMAPLLTTLREDVSIARAAALLESQNLQRVPVVNGGRVVGMLSSTDILRWLSLCYAEN